MGRYASRVEARTHSSPIDALHDAYLRAIARSALRTAEERARKRSLAIARLRKTTSDDRRRMECAR